MSFSRSAHSIVTTRPRVHKRWVFILLFLLGVILAAWLIYRSSPMVQLADARARWAANGYSDYRIIVKYELPLYSCEQDLEIRNGELDYRNQDSCRMTPIVGSNQGIMEMLTVAGLFARVEGAITAPECGPNGCVCDGPVTADVIYEPEMGYPQQIVYRLAPENRWRYIEFWTAQVSGAPPCPPASYIGQHIEVISLNPLKPKVEIDAGNLLEELTPKVGDSTPEVKPTFPPTFR